MTSHITGYERMPIPPVEEHTEHFDAGAVRFSFACEAAATRFVAEER